MDREQQFIGDLHQSKSSHEAELALAEREIHEARLIPRRAAELWAKGDEDIAFAAFGFLLHMEDLAIVPILESPLRGDASTISKAMRLLTQKELNLRTRIVHRVDQWLDDKRPVPQMPLLIPIEGRVRQRRVCDEAYISMRHLAHFGESEIMQMVDEDRLYDLSEEQRDAAIQRARETKSWQLIMDPSTDEGD